MSPLQSVVVLDGSHHRLLSCAWHIVSVPQMALILVAEACADGHRLQRTDTGSLEGEVMWDLSVVAKRGAER